MKLVMCMSKASLLGFVVLIFVLISCTSRSVQDKRPNIVLITIDTLRQDHLSIYGYTRSTTPSLKNHAEAGIVFSHAQSQAEWTLPSLGAIHTGKYASEHGATLKDLRISPETPMIAERLRNAGYDTVAVVAHWFAGSRHGFAQGFQSFDETLALGPKAITSKKLTDLALRKIRGKVREPFFLWVHYFDAHNDYMAHDQFDFAHHETKGARSRSSLDIEQVKKWYEANPTTRSENKT